MNCKNKGSISLAALLRVCLVFAAFSFFESSWAASDLTTSVKSVVNTTSALNYPGDTLRYTISLIETSGNAATGVSVVDVIPSETTNLTNVSFPAGATNNSTSATVDISNITVPASSTATISFDVDISLGTAVGTKIDNTAQITDPNGVDPSVSAPSLYIFGSPSNGSKLLYFADLDGTNDLSRDRDLAVGSKTSIQLDGEGGSVIIDLTPATTKPLTLGAGPININLWLHRNNKGKNIPREVELLLGYQSGSGGGGSTGTIGTDSESITLARGEGAATLNAFVINLASELTLNANTEIFLEATNATPQNSNRRYTITSFLNSVPSTVELNADTVINIESISILDDTSGLPENTPVPGQTIRIRAVVSDPFGELDIEPNNSPTLTLVDPDSIDRSGSTSFSEVNPDGDLGTRTYDWTYTISMVPSQGIWSVTVTAEEGDEGTISNTAATNFNTNTISDLSQSTKTVTDKFGGEPEPGDVLVYTITMINSSTVDAFNVSVSDVISTSYSNFLVTGLPSGALDSSTSGTGPLNVTGITVPDSAEDLHGTGAGTAVITFEVTINAGLDPGDTINNTAGISNTAGIGANPQAATIILSPSQIPSTGNKPLYFDSLSTTPILTRTQPTGDTEINIAGAGNSATIPLSPVLQTAITLGAGPIPISLWLDGGGAQDGRERNIIVLIEYSGSSSGTIDSKFISVNLNDNVQQLSFLMNLASDLTLLSGTTLEFTLSNSSTNANRDVDLHSIDGVNFSNVNLNSNTVINIDSITIYAASGCTGSAITNANPSDTVYICAVISDPFGEADIEIDDTPDIIVTDPDSSTSYTPTLTEITEAPVNLATRTFQWQLALPASGVSLGSWAVQVTATEGQETSPVTHVASGGFTTENLPNLSSSTKSVLNLYGGDVDPGDALEYTISVVESGSTAISDPSFVTITDAIPDNTTLIPGSITTTSGSGSQVGSNVVIDNMEIAADGTETAKFQVTINAGTTPGTIINNSATISNPNGPGAAPQSASIIVSQSQIGTQGSKRVYLDNLTGACSGTCSGDLTRLINSGGTSADLNPGESITLNQTPALTKDLTLDSGPITSKFWLVGENKKNRDRTVGATLSYSGTSSGIIGSGSTTLVLLNGVFTEVPLTIDVSSDVTLLAGTTISLLITNASTNGNAEFDLYSDNGVNNESFVALNSSTLITVDSVKFYADSAGSAGTQISSANPGDTIHIQAQVSDPFGDFDIEPTDNAPNIVITDPDASTTNPETLNSYATDAGIPTAITEADASIRIFDWTLVLPDTPAPTSGIWDVQVTAEEGTEGTITDTGNGNFSVGVANFATSTKSVSVPAGDVDPGDILTYTITVTNSGTLAGTVDVIDNIPTNTTLVPGTVTVSGTYDSGASTESGTQLIIQDLQVAISSSETVVFQTQVDGGVAPGVIIDNSASIIAVPPAQGAGAAANSVVISESQLAGSGSKNIYFDSLTGDCSGACSGMLTRTEPSADSTVRVSGADNVDIVSPATELEITLGAGPIEIPVWMNGNNKNGIRTLTSTLSYSGPASGTIGSDTLSVSLSNDTANIILVQFSIDLAADLTLAAGTILTLNVFNNSNGNREIDIHALPAGETINSAVSLNSNTVLEIESLTIHADAGSTGGAVITSASPGDIVYIQAIVSDPFGDFDIEPVDDQPDITVTDPISGTQGTLNPIGAVIISDETPTNTDPARYTYEWELTIANDANSIGQWQVDVTAKEGLEEQVSDSVTTSFGVGEPNFTTSTKTPSDQNGGDVEPGDTIRYTVTIIESAGAAGEARLLDTIDANLTNLSIITAIDPGWTNNSTSSVVDISSIDVSASASVVIEFEANVVGGATPGTLINNSASLIATVGANGNATAATLIVSESALSGAGTKPLYLGNLATTPILTRVRPTANELTVGNSSEVTINLTPALVKSFTLTAGDLTVFLWLYRNGSDDNRSVNAKLSYFGASSGTIDDDSQFVSLGTSLATGTRVPFVLNVPSDLTLTAGTQLRLTIANQTATGGEDLVVAAFNVGQTDPYSQVNLNASTVINIDSTDVYDASHDGLTIGGGGNLIVVAEPGATIYIRSTVSDPFGSFDINPACPDIPNVADGNCPNIEVTDSLAVSQVTANMQLKFDDVATAVQIFEYTYAIPGGGAGGIWEFDMVATEGEEGDVTDSDNKSFMVGSPNVTIVQYSTGQATYDPGDEITYTLVVSNTGTADATNMKFTVNVSEFVAFGLDSFGSEVPLNLTPGTYTLGTVTYSDDNGSTYTYDPFSGSPPTHDPNITDFSAVIVEELENGDSVTLLYKAKVQN